MLTKQIHELLPLAAKIAREFANIPGLPHAEIVIDTTLLRHPKDRYADAGKLLAALAKINS